MRVLLPFITFLSSAFAQSVSENRPPEARGMEPELISPLGQRFESAYDEQGLVAKAAAALAESPGDLDIILSAGQAYAAVFQFKSAIATFTKGIFAAPSDPRFYRYRGHRHLSLRHFDEGIADLEKAKSIAPDSFEVAYYLGLAHYFKGDFAKAAAEHGRCLDQAASGAKPAASPMRACAAISDEARAALTVWRYLALERAGDKAAAAKHLKLAQQKFQVPETETYHRVIAALRGEAPAEGLLETPVNPALAYPVAQSMLVGGERLKACVLLNDIVKAADWSALGFIAAESDLVRHKVCN